MTAVAIALCAAAIGWSIATVVLARELADAVRSDRASFAAEVNATRERIDVEAQRDDALAEAKRLRLDVTAAANQLAAVNSSLVRARKELIDRVEAEIIHARPGDAGRLVDELLARPLLPAGDDPAATAGDDHGRPAATAVLVAADPAAGGDGRSSGR